MNNPIDRNAVARRAYELYLARGRQEGHAVEDWLRAEHEVAAKTATTTSATAKTDTSKTKTAARPTTGRTTTSSKSQRL